MLDTYLYSGLRTPFGRVAGALAPVRPDDLVAKVIRQAVEYSGFRPDQIEDVVSRVNPSGGAIAVGHPLGATGARILLNAARELARRGRRYAVVSLCIGVGQGLAVVIEHV